MVKPYIHHGENTAAADPSRRKEVFDIWTYTPLFLALTLLSPLLFDLSFLAPPLSSLLTPSPLLTFPLLSLALTPATTPPLPFFAPSLLPVFALRSFPKVTTQYHFSISA